MILSPRQGAGMSFFGSALKVIGFLVIQKKVSLLWNLLIIDGSIPNGSST